MTTPRHIIGMDMSLDGGDVAGITISHRDSAGKIVTDYAALERRIASPPFQVWLLKWCRRFPVIGRWVFLWWLIAKRVWAHGWGCQWVRRSQMEFWDAPLSPRDYAYLGLLKGIRNPLPYFPYIRPQGPSLAERMGPPFNAPFTISERSRKVGKEIFEQWRKMKAL